MTNPTCTACKKRPAIDASATLCRHCRDQLDKALGDITAITGNRTSHFDYTGSLLDILDAYRTGQTAINTTSTPRPTSPTGAPQRHDYRTHRAWRQAYDYWAQTTDQQPGELPLERAGRLADELHQHLTDTTRELGLTTVAPAIPIERMAYRTTLHWPDPTTRDLATQLLHHIHDIAHHNHAPNIHATITRAVARITQAIDRPPDRWYAGRCYLDNTCNADLWATRGDHHVICQACGARYDLQQLRTALLTEAEDQTETAEVISRALTSVGEPVTPSMIRGYRYRGRLLEHGRDKLGHPLYRLGDVRAIVAEIRRRTSASA